MSMNANIVVRLQAQAMRTPAAPAIISDNQVLNFEQARFCAGVIAAHLKRQGVEPGQHVGVAMGQNSLHLLVLWAVAQIGAVSVPLHPAVPADRRLAAARKFAVAHVVSGREDMALPGLHFIGLGNLEFGPLSSVDHEVAPLAADAGFRVMMSSGTSGDPKGMMLTHGLMQLRGTMKEELCHPTQRVVSMDLNFVAGFRLAVHALMHGASVVLPRSLQAQQFLADVIRFGSTHLHLSPA
ncbi:MAG: AMP-binding protein, partial [Paucibacter sp.]|nr:AMP-binding protein [Roseateles sp.]